MSHLDRPCYQELRNEVRALADELQAQWEKQKGNRGIRGKDVVDRAKVILTDIREKLLATDVVKRCGLEQDIKLCRCWWKEIDRLTMDLPRYAALWSCLWVWHWNSEAYAYYDKAQKMPEHPEGLNPDHNWRIAGEDEIRCKVLKFLRWYVDEYPSPE